MPQEYSPVQEYKYRDLLLPTGFALCPGYEKFTVLRFLNRSSRYTYVTRTNKMHTFFINELIQLYCLRHVSNNQMFIIRKTVQAALRYFVLHHLYKQSSRCQDV